MMNIVIAQILAFLAAIFFVTGLASAFRSKEEESNTGKPFLFSLFAPQIDAMARLTNDFYKTAFPTQCNRLRRDIVAAGLHRITAEEVRGLQGVMGVFIGLGVGGGIFLISLNWTQALCACLFAGFMGWVYPPIWVGGCATRRKDAMSRDMPFTIDLITVAMQAGQDFGAAVRYLVKEGPRGPLCQEFAVMLRQIELGRSRIEALVGMADRIQLDEFRSIVTSVTQSSEMGASIAATLKLQAEELRRTRYHRTERQAARAPSLMLIPVALFILPAVFIIIITPMIIKFTSMGIGGIP